MCAYLSIWEVVCTVSTHTRVLRGQRGFFLYSSLPFVFRHYFSLNMKHIILGSKQAPSICLSLSPVLDPILELHTAHATCLTEYGCLGFGLRASCLHNKFAPAANCWFCILKIDLRGLHMPLYLVYCLCCRIGHDISRFFFFLFLLKHAFG